MYIPHPTSTRLPPAGPSKKKNVDITIFAFHRHRPDNYCSYFETRRVLPKYQYTGICSTISQEGRKDGSATTWSVVVVVVVVVAVVKLGINNIYIL